MRNLIDNPAYMTYEEMEEKFIGKWVFHWHVTEY